VSRPDAPSPPFLRNVTEEAPTSVNVLGRSPRFGGCRVGRRDESFCKVLKQLQGIHPHRDRASCNPRQRRAPPPPTPNSDPVPAVSPYGGALPTTVREEAFKIRRRQFYRVIACVETVALVPGPNTWRIKMRTPFREHSLRSAPFAQRARATRHWALVPWGCAFVVRRWLGMYFTVRKVPCGCKVARWCDCSCVDNRGRLSEVRALLSRRVGGRV